MRNQVKQVQSTNRVVITGVMPELDAGRFPIISTVGESVVVEADIFAEGSAAVYGQLLYRQAGVRDWLAVPMQPIGNDRWRGEFPILDVRDHEYTVAAGTGSIESAADQVTYGRVLGVRVAGERAGHGAWYQLFPRSCAVEPGRHGTWADVEALLPYVAGMGFDVLLLPPIHPIGETNRRSRNNTAAAGPDDPGSPWAVGSSAGGHTAIHPQLGTLAGLQKLIASAKHHHLEIALEVTLACSPDHPWVAEHTAWFEQRADGQLVTDDACPDITRLDLLGGDDQRVRWEAVASMFRHWIEQGILLFVVDSPHQQPFAFWDWLIRSLKKRWPDVVLVAKSFTRPKVVRHLAKLGFDQSFTYFTWRNSKADLEAYRRELLALTDGLRPTFWPNTPDILSRYLSEGGVAAFEARLVLAATLCANYGIYGPAYELQVSELREAGAEEYRDSEKYELKHWQRDNPDSLYDFIARLNHIRRHHPALYADRSLRFLKTDNEHVIAYRKQCGDNVIVTAVNLDPHRLHTSWLELSMLEPAEAHDLISGTRYAWHGPQQLVSLDPGVCPAQVFHIVH